MTAVRKRGSKQECGRWGSSGSKPEHEGLGDPRAGKGQGNAEHASKTPPLPFQKVTGTTGL